jgi:transcriptional regulator with XRE-family HTH domain
MILKGRPVSNCLGEKIRKLRKAKELTLEELAEQTDSSKGYIWELENRDTKKPSAEKLLKIAEVLGVTNEFLLDDSKKKPDDEILKTAFFRKFEKLEESDQKKLMKIIEDWGN